VYNVILENKLESLGDEILIYSNETTDRIGKSVESFLNNDVDLARHLIKSTDEINKDSYKIEDGCLKVLGLHQPVAKDLRMGAALLRTSIELERINNLSAYIARYTIDSEERGLNYHKPPHIMFMSQTVQNMLKDGVGALLNNDIQLLKRSTKNYNNLQDFYNQMFSEYNEITHGGSHTYLILVGRNLLSMGHHVMGMADRIAYCIVGKRVMHTKLFHNLLMR
jgi:phosphate transport system protein